MNTKRTIYEKINSISPKVELAQVEVELGLLQDVEKNIETTGVKSQKSFDMAFKAKGDLFEAMTMTKTIVKEYQSIYVELTKLSSTIKDLGLPNIEINDKLKLIKSRISNQESIVQNITKAIAIL